LNSSYNTISTSLSYKYLKSVRISRTDFGGNNCLFSAKNRNKNLSISFCDLLKCSNGSKDGFFSKTVLKEDLYITIEIVLHNFQANKQAIINKKTIILLNNGRELVAVDLVQILYIEFQQN